MTESVAALIRDYQERGLKIATAESCTGGMVGAALTDISGSAAVFERGFIVYSNEAKIEMLGVARALIEAHGAVSQQVACAMAEGAIAHSAADVAVSITGIAGPTGGSEAKPVGLVYFGVQRRNGGSHCEEWRFQGDRAAIRLAAKERALTLLAKQLL